MKTFLLLFIFLFLQIPLLSQTIIKEYDNSKNIAFVLEELKDKDVLYQQIPLNYNIVQINKENLALEQITSYLKDIKEINSIHILAHGRAGVIQLGDLELSSKNIDLYANEFTLIAKHLSKDADILIYSCELNKNNQAVNLINKIQKYTNADIAVSNNLTGNLPGADWSLEDDFGKVECENTLKINCYSDLLSIINTSVRARLGYTSDTGNNWSDWKSVGSGSGTTLTENDGLDYGITVSANPTTNQITINYANFNTYNNEQDQDANFIYVEFKDGSLGQITSATKNNSSTLNFSVSLYNFVNNKTIRQAFSNSGIINGTIIIDITSIDAAPSITSITNPSNQTYKENENINFTMNWSSAVTISGSPRIALNIGGTTKYATYVSGSGTTATVFRYTVESGLNDNDGIAVTSGSVDLNGGTIKDGSNNDATLTLASISSLANVKVDAVSPTVSSVTAPSNATYRIGQNMDFVVNFSEAVNKTGSPQLSLNIGGNTRQATYLSGTGTSAITFRYTVQGSDSDQDGIAINSLGLNSGTIKDAVTHDASLTLNSVANTSSILVDGTILVDNNTDANDGNYAVGQLTLREAASLATSGSTINFASSLNSANINLTNPITFASNVTFELTQVNTLSINGSTIILEGQLSIVNGFNGNITIYNSITGIGSISKSGFGTLNLMGTSNFSEGLRILQGTVSPFNGGTVGTGNITLLGGVLACNAIMGSSTFANNIVLESNSTIIVGTDITISGAISGNYKLSKSGSAKLTLTGNSSLSNSQIQVDAGTLSISVLNNLPTGRLTFDGGTLQVTSNINSLFMNPITIGTSGATFLISATTVTMSGQISGSGNLTKTGTGYLFLSGNSTSTWTGNVTVSEGSFLAYQIGSIITLMGTKFDTQDMSFNINNNFVLNGNCTFTSGTGTLSLNGVISGSGNFVKTNNGIIELAGTNTYTGKTTVSSGTLKISNDNNLGSDSLILASLTTLDLISNAVINNNILLTGNATIKASADASISGVISGAFSLTKTGTSKLTLSGTNTYTGATTVSAGELSLTGSISSNTSVSSGATFSGNGTVTGNLTINSGSTLSPGTTSNGAGIITVSGTLYLYGSLIVDLNGTTAGTGYDQISIGEDFNINNNGTFTVNKNFSPSNAQLFTILNVTSNTTSDGTFTGYAENSIYTASSTPFRVSYIGNTGNDFTLKTIPYITSVTLPSNSTYSTSNNLDFEVTYNVPVNVTNTPRLALTIGSSTKYATYQSQPTSSSLLFRYTVETGLLDLDGISLASPIDLNSTGTIKDADLNNVALTFTPGSTNGILVDATVPTISLGNLTQRIVNGITIESNNVTASSSTVSEKGIVYGTSTSPTINDSKQASLSTGIGTYDISLSSLHPETKYYYRAYATNTAGTAYSSESNAYTLSTEPTAHSSLTATAGQSNIVLTFQVASSIGADGYILLRKQSVTAPDASGISDGASSIDFNLPNGTTLVSVITNINQTTFDDQGLTPPNTLFSYALIPFNWDGTNSATYNYRTSTTIPTASATTGIPVVSTGTKTNFATTSITITGSNVISEGGANVTDRGVVWSTSPNPTIANNKVATNPNPASGTGTYDVNITGLTAGTKYYARAYATSSIATSYGSEITFYTAPNTQASNITWGSVTRTSITANWINGSGANRLVLVKKGSPISNTPLTNESVYTANSILGTGSAVDGGSVVYHSTGNSVTVTGLTNNTLYYFRVFESVGSGSEVVFNQNTAATNPTSRNTNRKTGAEGGNVFDFDVLTISPNPAKDFIKIDFTLPEEIALKMQIFDLQGNLMYSLSDANLFSTGHNQQTIDCSNFTQGTYYLSMTNGSEAFYYSFVVER